MTILAIIGAALFTIFSQASGAWLRAGGRTEQFLAARETLGMIAMELRQAVVAPNAASPYGAHFYGIVEGDNPFNRDNIVANNGQVYFVAPTETRSGDASQDLCVIGYWVRYDPNAPNNDTSPVLIRYCLSDNNKSDWSTFKPDSNNATNQELGLNVRSLRFEFWDPNGNDWGDASDSWTTDNYSESPEQYGTLPKAVRITLVVQDPTEPTNTKLDKTFMTIVRLNAAE